VCISVEVFTTYVEVLSTVLWLVSLLSMSKSCWIIFGSALVTMTDSNCRLFLVWSGLEYSSITRISLLMMNSWRSLYHTVAVDLFNGQHSFVVYFLRGCDYFVFLPGVISQPVWLCCRFTGICSLIVVWGLFQSILLGCLVVWFSAVKSSFHWLENWAVLAQFLSSRGRRNKLNFYLFLFYSFGLNLSMLDKLFRVGGGCGEYVLSPLINLRSPLFLWLILRLSRLLRWVTSQIIISLLSRSSTWQRVWLVGSLINHCQQSFIRIVMTDARSHAALDATRRSAVVQCSTDIISLNRSIDSRAMIEMLMVGSIVHFWLASRC